MTDDEPELTPPENPGMVPAPDRPAAVPQRKAELLELLVFVFLITPSIIMNMLGGKPGGWLQSMSFRQLSLMTILQDLALICLVHYFLWRNGDSPARIGWTLRRGWLDVLLALVLFYPYAWLLWLITKMLVALGLASPAPMLPSYLAAHGRGEYLLATLLVMVVAVAEETLYRGYLYLRIKNVTSSRVAAVVLAALIFSAGHGYQSLTAMMVITVIAVIYSLLYLWRGSLVLPIVMHFLQNFILLVIVPLMRLKGR
jgi:membrane protease YdiL (CAAX protease family)